MLRQQDVGHRIVVRRIVGVRGERPLFSDALGELVDLTETHLTLATAKGPLRVPLTEVHRAKRVPPARRPTAPAVVELELAADEAWPAPVRDRLGGWLLRAADGWTGRANSALPVGDPDRPLDEAVDAVRAWYAARGQPALINVPLPLAAPIGTALDERGWGSRPPVLVQTAPLAALLAATPDRPDLPPVRLSGTPSPGWLALAAHRKSARAAEPAAPELPAAARHVLTAVHQVRFAQVIAAPGTGARGAADPAAGGPTPGDGGPTPGDGGPAPAADGPAPGDGELIALARGTVTGAGRWLGLSLVEVVPAARRHGLANHVIRSLARWAAELGATGAFLQVEERNEAAVSLYRRLGFTTHHTYRTRSEPGPAGGR